MMMTKAFEYVKIYILDNPTITKKKDSLTQLFWNETYIQKSYNHRINNMMSQKKSTSHCLRPCIRRG